MEVAFGPLRLGLPTEAPPWQSPPVGCRLADEPAAQHSTPPLTDPRTPMAWPTG